MAEPRGYLTDREVSTCINALRLAAETFRNDCLRMQNAGLRRLAQQFEQQARESLDLAIKLEEQ